ncbi:MAG: hypothetical protein A2V93_04950 [Ignavibacteria bacterium RBG_16_34_14]|nr:MAG: hypothetical protein A2V93_04950 [Ignavibacteria bacterium RBG_16_34_14]
MQESERLKNKVEVETGRFSGRLRIGIIPTIAPYLLSKFLTVFMQKYPDVELIVDEITTHEIVASINKDKIDLNN